MPESLNTMGIAKEVLSSFSETMKDYDDLKGNMVSLSSSMASKEVVSFLAAKMIYEVGVIGDARVRMRSEQRSVEGQVVNFNFGKLKDVNTGHNLRLELQKKCCTTMAQTYLSFLKLLMIAHYSTKCKLW